MKRSKVILAGLLIVVASLPVCANKNAQEEPEARASAGSDAGTEPVAYVAGGAVTADEMMSKVPQRTRDQIDQMMKALRKQAVVDKMLEAEAKERGVSVDELVNAEGVEFSQNDLESRLPMETRQQLYDLKRTALERIVADKLLAQEATTRGVALPDLLKTEVTDKAPAPSESEVNEFYEANKDRAPELRNQSKEQALPQIEAALRQQATAVRHQQFVDQLMAAADVRVVLDPPRADVVVPSGEPAKGPEDAPVTIVEFSDYQCPYCRRAEVILEKVMADYGDKIRFVYRDFIVPGHNRAVPAGAAARCAGDQGKYWEYHDSLLDSPGTFEDDDLKKRASDLALDMAAFEACYDSGRHTTAVQNASQEGSDLGVTGTPTFFINGRMIVGAKPYEEFKSILDDEISRASEKSSEVGG